jgi:hypothetical protein
MCARVSADAGVSVGRPVKLVADLNQMHLIDSGNGRVL